jgi:serine O-acetyltransferase
VSDDYDEQPLFSQLAEDWAAHGKDWTRPGFRAIAVHRFGNWRMKVKPKVLRAPFSVLYRAMFRGVRNIYDIELPYTVKVGRRVVFQHQGSVVIHGAVEIGDDSVIRQGVTLGNKRLDQPDDAPKIGKRVNVGAGAKVLGAVVVGDDAAIGANSVVLKHVDQGTTVVGVPARPMRDNKD